MSIEKQQLVLDFHKSKKESLKEKIVIAYKPLVEYIAHKMAYNRSDYEDLVQVGNIGLLRSLDRFDPSKKIEFSTFATPNIIGEIKHYFRDKNRLLKFPRKLQEIYSKIKTLLRESQKLGKELTIAEIANHLGETEEKILEAMEMGQTSNLISLDSPNYKSDLSGSENKGSLIDTIGVEGDEETVIKKITLKQILDKLDPREKKSFIFVTMQACHKWR